MRLDGKAAIVTGAAQGIGLGIAHALAAAGAAVTLADVADAKGENAARELQAGGARVHYQHTDVAAEADVRALVEAAAGRWGRLDIVVNNAGIVAVQTVEQSTVEEWDRVLAVNVRSIFLTTKYALPHLRRAGGGAILNIASVSSFVAQQGTPAMRPTLTPICAGACSACPPGKCFTPTTWVAPPSSSAAMTPPASPARRWWWTAATSPLPSFNLQTSRKD